MHFLTTLGFGSIVQPQAETAAPVYASDGTSFATAHAVAIGAHILALTESRDLASESVMFSFHCITLWKTYHYIYTGNCHQLSSAWK